jgi:hypothetical protein
MLGNVWNSTGLGRYISYLTFGTVRPTECLGCVQNPWFHTLSLTCTLLKIDQILSNVQNQSSCMCRTAEVYLYIYLWLYSPLLDLGSFFSFLILYTVSRTPWAGDQPVARPLPTHRINSHRHPCLEWDSNPWAKIAHALDRAATVIG